MLFSFRSKILLFVSMIILSGSFLMVTIIHYSTRSGYETFVKQNDINLSLSLRDPLSEYYRYQGDWTGIETFFQFPRQRSGPMRNMMNRNHFDGSRLKNMIPAVVLTDADGRILLNTAGEFHFDKDSIGREHFKTGVEILVDDRTVGYILSGSMLKRGLNENEERFLNKTTFIIIVVSLFILAVSIVFSYFFSWRITRPLSALTRAAGGIESGDFRGRVSVEGRDELSELTRSFNKMAQSLENNDKWRKQIIADSAHELRTPVSLIQGNLEMILDDVYKPDREHLQSIYDETLILARLIEELQQLSSAESGSMILNREIFDLNGLIENVVNIFRTGQVQDQIQLINSIKGSLPLVEGDPHKLKQVFCNVLANAFRHTPEKGTIEIKGQITGSSVLITIEDSGPGIDAEDLERVFERFYRTDNSRNRNDGGAGLGLAISREIIKLHGGTIHAESHRGRGALFVISIPFKK